MNIKTTISRKDKAQMIVGVDILNRFDNITLSNDTLKTVIENVLIWLDIEDEKEDQ